MSGIGVALHVNLNGQWKRNLAKTTVLVRLPTQFQKNRLSLKSSTTNNNKNNEMISVTNSANKEKIKMKKLIKYIRPVIAAFALTVVATPTMATDYYRVLSGFTAGSGVLTFGNHCEATVALNPPIPPLNVVEVQLHGAEAPTLTFVPWDFFIESPTLTMPAPRSAGGVIVWDGTKEWWVGYAYEFNGAFDSGDWTVYIDDHPSGCGFYDNRTRLLIRY